MVQKPSYSLTPAHRLHYSWEYRTFFGQSQVFRLSCCTIFRIPNQLDHFRLGITLKARGSSPERNRIKRKIREGMRKLGPFLGSFDYNVVIPGTKRMDINYAKNLGKCLEAEFSASLRSGVVQVAKPTGSRPPSGTKKG